MSNWFAKKPLQILSSISHPSRVSILELLTRIEFATNKSIRRALRMFQPKSSGNSPSVITHHVGLLEKAGLIRHTIEDPRIIIITPAGRRVARALRQIITESESMEPWDRSL